VGRAVLALLDPRAEKRWRIDGVGQSVELGGKTVKIAIQDELGRIDLNHADGPLLSGLFRSAGLDRQAADKRAGTVLAWRRSGAVGESSAGGEQDKSVRPRNAAFQSVDEIMLLSGMSRELFGRVRPALTVYSGAQFFDPRTAPREALL